MWHFKISNTIYKSRSFSPGVDTLGKMTPSKTDTYRVYFLKYCTSHCLERLLFRHQPTYPKTKKRSEKRKQIEIERRWKRERGDEETGKEAEKKRDRNTIHTEMEIEGGDEAWQNTITVRFSAAIRSLTKLRTPKLQAHTGIEIEEEKSKCH